MRLASRQRLFPRGEHASAGEHRHAGLLGQVARCVLQPEISQMLRPWADECDSRRRQALGEFNTLGEKAVAGMHGLRPGVLAGFDDRLDVQIALRRWRRADAHRFIRRQNGGRETVRIGIDGDGAYAHAAQRAADAAQYLAAIGD